MLESARLVSIIREVEEKEIISIIEGLVEEGIRWFEISLSDGENGMKCIRTSRKYFDALHSPFLRLRAWVAQAPAEFFGQGRQLLRA